MDTVWQHARMFGYRLAYLAYVRVYLPKRLAARFQQIHFSELELRTALRKDPSSRPVFLTIPTRTRATRANAVDDAPHVTIAADREQIEPHFVNNDEAAIVATIETLARLGVPIDEARRDHRATAVAMDAALELIRGVGKRIDDPGGGRPMSPYQSNRNFVRFVALGAIALVPMPSLGVAGRVTRRFEVEDDPPWGEDYLALRRAQGLESEPETLRVADIVQSCVVDELRPVAFSLVPAWIRRSLLERSMFGRIADAGAGPVPARRRRPADRRSGPVGPQMDVGTGRSRRPSGRHGRADLVRTSVRRPPAARASG